MKDFFKKKECNFFFLCINLDSVSLRGLEEGAWLVCDVCREMVDAFAGGLIVESCLPSTVLITTWDVIETCPSISVVVIVATKGRLPLGSGVALGLDIVRTRLCPSPLSW